MLTEKQKEHKDLMEKVLGKKVTDAQFLSMMQTTPKGSLKF